MLQISPHLLRLKGQGVQAPNSMTPNPKQPQNTDKRAVLDEIVELMTQGIDHQTTPIKRRAPPGHRGLFAEFCVEQTILDPLPERVVGILQKAKTFTFLLFKCEYPPTV